jgi:phytoene dehydrogenase-like protein
VIVGAGPNGLAAAITLARAGRSVRVIEARDTVGGAMRSAALTLPGFVHDTCSAVYPLALASPFFRGVALAEHGLHWIQPTYPLAHPFEDGGVALLQRSVHATASGLGDDARAWHGLFGPLANDADKLVRCVLGPLRWPRHPLALARFGLPALRSSLSLLEGAFGGREARALFAGLAAHANLPLEQSGSAAFGLFLGLLAHRVGWPLPRGGAQQVAEALAGCLRAHGGEIDTNHNVESLATLPAARVLLLDVPPRALLALAGERFPSAYRERLGRFRHGPGVFKLDLALDGPVPWSNEHCAQAGTVHVGGTYEEIAIAEGEVWEDKHPQRPFVLLAQPSRFDPARAPEGQHVVWAYCHVPHGSTFDMSERIEAQIERFAPGLRGRIRARSARDTVALQRDNPNLVGGDINGGVMDLSQLFARPAGWRRPYATPDPDIFLCSASTPPGGGVHGMCGLFAARAALHRLRKHR